MASTKKTAAQIWAKYTEVIGPSKALPTADLPTLRDVLQQVLLLKESRPTKEKSISVFEDVTSMVVEKWRHASIRLVQPETRISNPSIHQKIERSWERITSYRGKKKGRGRSKGDDFHAKLDKLFSILICHCPFISCEVAKCQEQDCAKAHISCTCPLAHKVCLTQPASRSLISIRI